MKIKNVVVYSSSDVFEKLQGGTFNNVQAGEVVKTKRSEVIAFVRANR